MTNDARRLEVDQFIADQIDSVPHLEALLLLWNTRPRTWTADEMAKSLYVRSEQASKILEGLAQRSLIVANDSVARNYHYVSGSDTGTDELMDAVAATYKKELVRISSLIHSKASVGVRDFARAFRFTKDKE